MIDGTQWEDLSHWYPEAEFWYLETKHNEEVKLVTMSQIESIFEPERIIRMQNGFDRHFFLFKKE